MNYVIIENDSLSLRRIKAMCEKLRPEWHLVFTASTVEDACRLFELNPEIGLALCDIELDDGLSLSIFRKIPAEFPVYSSRHSTNTRSTPSSSTASTIC